jgi:hypothetical protein
LDFPELSLDQRRALIDAQQKFTAWREADRAFRELNRGSMSWKRVGDREYLYRIEGKVQKSLGVRGPETERIKAEYRTSRTTNRRRVTKMRDGIKGAARLNRAMGLARVPKIAANVLRALDQDGLLGDGIFVVGTHSLFAYKAQCGIIFAPELLTTTDLDLLADVRTRLVLAIDESKRRGAMACLHRVDDTFAVQGDLFRAVNADGYFVDLIGPMAKSEATGPKFDLGGIKPVTIEGLVWLVNAPRFNAIAIAEDGEPVFISCIDPRAFALPKIWVSKQPTRDRNKSRRDAAQAAAVAQVARLLGLDFNRRDLAALPRSLLDGLTELPRDQ